MNKASISESPRQDSIKELLKFELSLKAKSDLRVGLLGRITLKLEVLSVFDELLFTYASKFVATGKVFCSPSFGKTEAVNFVGSVPVAAFDPRKLCLYPSVSWLERSFRLNSLYSSSAREEDVSPNVTEGAGEELQDEGRSLVVKEIWSQQSSPGSFLT